MKIAIGLLVLIVLLIGGVFALPFLVDLNKYQDQYKPLIEEALNRKVQLQDIRLTVWPRVGARVAGFAVQDDPVFSSGPFASLSSLDVGVKLMPLLSGKVEVEEITLHNPVSTVIKGRAGSREALACSDSFDGRSAQASGVARRGPRIARWGEGDLP
jgi:AsmA protein